MIVDLVSDTWNADGVKQWGRVQLGMIPCDDKVFRKANSINLLPKQAAYFREKVRPNIDNCANLVEKFLVENDGSNLLLSGDNVNLFSEYNHWLKITWADVYVAEFFSKCVDFGEKDCLEAYPHIQALIDRVHNEPTIKKVHIFVWWFLINFPNFSISKNANRAHSDCIGRNTAKRIRNTYFIKLTYLPNAKMNS